MVALQAQNLSKEEVDGGPREFPLNPARLLLPPGGRGNGLAPHTVTKCEQHQRQVIQRNCEDQEALA